MDIVSGLKTDVLGDETRLMDSVQGGSKKVSCCTVIDISMARQ